MFYACTKGLSIPKWNIFSEALVRGTMDLANVYLADEGFFVTMSLAKHI